jgi:hypothetical protein
MPHEQTIHRLRTLKPGERVTYFIGYLDSDRLADPLGPANTLAMIAFDLCREGKIHLTQKRLGPPLSRGVVDWKGGHGPGFKYIATGALVKQSKRYAQPVISNPLSKLWG